MPMIERLALVFHRAFGLERSRFSLEATPEEIPNWDSVGHMSLVSHLEQEFGVQFELDEIIEMSSPRKIVDLLQAKGVRE